MQNRFRCSLIGGRCQPQLLAAAHPLDLPLPPDRLCTAAESLHMDQFRGLVHPGVPGTSSTQVLIEARANVSSIPCVIAAVFAENDVDIVALQPSDSLGISIACSLPMYLSSRWAPRKSTNASLYCRSGCDGSRMITADHRSLRRSSLSSSFVLASSLLASRRPQARLEQRAQSARKPSRCQLQVREWFRL